MIISSQPISRHASWARGENYTPYRRVLFVFHLDCARRGCSYHWQLRPNARVLSGAAQLESGTRPRYERILTFWPIVSFCFLHPKWAEQSTMEFYQNNFNHMRCVLSIADSVCACRFVTSIWLLGASWKALKHWRNTCTLWRLSLNKAVNYSVNRLLDCLNY